VKWIASGDIPQAQLQHYGLATADLWSKPILQEQALAIRSQNPSNSSLRDEIGLSKGSGPYSNPEKPSWAALLDHQPNQFAVIDNRTVITGSFNWSPSAAHQNDEVLLVIESPLLAAHFTREMDRLWRGAELGINERLTRKLAANRRRCGSGVRRVNLVS